MAVGGHALAAVEVNVTHVGFPGVGAGNLIRAGAWIPVIVDVALTNEASFDGAIRVAQLDGDGDECFDEVELHLRADTGGARRVFLFVPANPRGTSGRFAVEVRAEDGEAVRVVSQGERTFQAMPGRQPEVIGEDDVLILLVSSTAMGRLSNIVGADFRDHFIHPLHLAHVSPADLPELWIGLDAVDYVIWDDAKPEELTPRQLESLLDWTRQGGTLLVAASRSAGSLRLSKALEPVLPVELGELISVENLPEVRRTVLDAPKDAADFTPARPWETIPFVEPVPLVRTTRRGDAQIVTNESSIDSDVVVRGRLGAGQVISMGITLQDLLSGPGGLDKFFTHVLRIRASDRADGGRVVPNPLLFDRVVSAVSFATSSSVYLLVAALFSVAYALAATLGTWKVLGIRGWQNHSWSAFAGVAVVASTASLVMVGWMHGFGDRLHQIAIIDAAAGETTGHATAFFGLKTSIDKEVDVWLPSDWVGAREPDATTCFLRPLPEGGQAGDVGTSFADPDEYRLSPASSLIDDVRVRGTLKRFEGRWDGPIGGKVHGKIVVAGTMISKDSYIINELGVTLTNCFLLQPVLNIGDTAVGRDQAIYAFPIGDIPSDPSAKVPVYDLCYRTTRGEKIKDIKGRNVLEKRHVEWSAPFQGILSALAYGSSSQSSFAAGDEQDALLLLSTLGEFDADTISQRAVDWGAPQTWSRDRMRRLDLRQHLHAGLSADKRFGPQPGCVVLVGFARGPGPIRLFARTGQRDFRPVKPDENASWCMYRIRIPTTRLASAADAEDEEAMTPGVAP